MRVFGQALGRQGLAYDDQHLLGELNWGGTLSHDVALTKFEKDRFKASFSITHIYVPTLYAYMRTHFPSRIYAYSLSIAHVEVST